MGKLETGLDIGPSTIAVVNKDKVELKKFCTNIPNLDRHIAKLQRKLARKLRLSNPQNFNEKGAVIKGSKHWIKTNEYKKLENKVNYLNHKLASRRKQEHGILVNKIVKESIANLI